MDGMTHIGSEKGRVAMVSPLYMDPGALRSPDLLSSHHHSATMQDISKQRQQLVEAGKQFESYFVSYLLKVMRETVPQGAIANKQGAYFYSFYDEEIGRRAAESGGLGITQLVQEYAEQNFSSRL
jgi:flagellar protein FlgJ